MTEKNLSGEKREDIKDKMPQNITHTDRELERLEVETATSNRLKLSFFLARKLYQDKERKQISTEDFIPEFIEMMEERLGYFDDIDSWGALIHPKIMKRWTGKM